MATSKIPKIHNNIAQRTWKGLNVIETRIDDKARIAQLTIYGTVESTISAFSYINTTCSVTNRLGALKTSKSNGDEFYIEGNQIKANGNLAAGTEVNCILLYAFA